MFSLIAIVLLLFNCEAMSLKYDEVEEQVSFYVEPENVIVSSMGIFVFDNGWVFSGRSTHSRSKWETFCKGRISCRMDVL